MRRGEAAKKAGASGQAGGAGVTLSGKLLINETDVHS